MRCFYIHSVINLVKCVTAVHPSVLHHPCLHTLFTLGPALATCADTFRGGAGSTSAHCSQRKAQSRAFLGRTLHVGIFGRAAARHPGEVAGCAMLREHRVMPAATVSNRI